MRLQASEYAISQFQATVGNYGSYRKFMSQTVIETRLESEFFSLDELKEAFAKFHLDNLVVPTGIHIYSFTPAFKSERVEVVIDFDNRTIATSLHRDEKTGKPKVQECREYVFVHFKGNRDRTASQTGLYDTRKVLALVGSMIRFCDRKETLNKLIADLKSKVIKDTIPYGRPKYEEYIDLYGEKVDAVPPERIAEDYKISPIGITLPNYTHLSGAKKYRKGVEFVICETDTLAEDFELIANTLKVAVASDKTNTKYCYYGPGAEALFVYRQGDELSSFHPINDERKGANRIASGFSLYANATDHAFSNLKIKLSNGSFTYTFGSPRHTMIAVNKRFNNGSGVALSSKEMQFSVGKKLSREVNIDSFGKDYIKSLGKSRQEIMENLIKDINNEPLLISEFKSGDAITFKGVEIAKNDKFFPLIPNSNPNEGKFLTAKSGGNSYADEVRSVEITTRWLYNAVKRNPKLRGTGKKLTTLVKPFTMFKLATSEVKADITGLDLANVFTGADIVLNTEAIKSAVAIIELFANDHIGKEVVIDGGKLYVDGVLVTAKAFKQWFDSKLNTYVIEEPISEYTKDTFEGFYGVYVEGGNNSTPIAECNTYIYKKGSQWVLRERFDAIVGICHYQVEVSTADENYGITSHGPVEQEILATYHEVVDKWLKTKADKTVDPATLLETDNNGTLANVDKVFTLPADLDNLRAFLAGSADESPKSVLGTLASKAKAIRIVLPYDAAKSGRKHEWVVNIPLAALLRFGRWDTNGNPLSCYTLDEDEANSRNILEDAFSLFKALETSDSEGLWFEYLSHFEAYCKAWIKGIKEGKTITNFMKAGSSWHVKVITDYNIGTDEKSGLPTILLNSESPLLKGNEPKDGRPVARIQAGDVVLVSRCPLPFFTACVVRIDDTYDVGMVGINPITWSKATRGDSDGK